MSEKYTDLERAALAADRARFNRARITEPLRSNGGPLDPEGWSMKLAEAVRDGTPLPPMYKDMDTASDHPSVLAAEAVLGKTVS